MAKRKGKEDDMSLEEAEELVYNDEYHIDYIELYNFDAEEVISMEPR